MPKDVQLKIMSRLLGPAGVNAVPKKIEKALKAIKVNIPINVDASKLAETEKNIAKIHKIAMEATKSAKTLEQSYAALSQTSIKLGTTQGNLTAKVKANAVMMRTATNEANKYAQALSRVNAAEKAGGGGVAGGLGGGTRRRGPTTRRARGFGKTKGAGRLGFAVGAADLLLGGMGDDMPSAMGTAFRMAGGIANGAGMGAMVGAAGGPIGAGGGALAGGAIELIKTIAEIRQANQAADIKIPDNVKKHMGDQDFLKTFSKRFDQEFNSIDPRSNRTGGRSKDIVRENQVRLREMARSFGGDAPETKEINRILMGGGFQRENVKTNKEIGQEHVYEKMRATGGKYLEATDARVSNYAAIREQREVLSKMKGNKGPEFNQKYLDSLISGMKDDTKLQANLKEKLSSPDAATMPGFTENARALAVVTERLQHGSSELHKYTNVLITAADVQKNLNKIKEKEQELSANFVDYIHLSAEGRQKFDNVNARAKEFAKNEGQHGLFNTMGAAAQSELITGLSRMKNDKIGAKGETGQQLIDKLQQGFGDQFKLTKEEITEKNRLLAAEKQAQQMAITAQQAILDRMNDANQNLLTGLNREFAALVANLNRINGQKPANMASGGKVAYKAMGGNIKTHPGAARGTDTIPAWLSPSEHVIRADMANKYRPILEAINAGTYQPDGFANGGAVYAQRGLGVPQLNGLSPYQQKRKDRRDRLGRVSRFERQGGSYVDRNFARIHRGRHGKFMQQHAADMKAWGQAGMKGPAPIGVNQRMQNSTAAARLGRAQQKRAARQARLAARGFNRGGAVHLANGGQVPNGSIRGNDGGYITLDSSKFAQYAMVFDRSVDKFGAAVYRLDSRIASLEQSVAGIPSQITVVGSHNLSVQGNGFQVMGELEPLVNEWISAAVKKAFGPYRGFTGSDGRLMRELDAGFGG